MMKRTKSLESGLVWFASILAAITLSTAATAATVFNQALAARFDKGGYNSNGPDNIPFIPTPAFQQIGDNFALADNTLLTGISWFGQYVGITVPDMAARDFVVRVFADNTGGSYNIPGTKILERRTAVAGVAAGVGTLTNEPILSYNLALTGAPVLSAGATYWVSILENDAATFNTWRWSYGATGTANRLALQFGEGAGWDILGPSIGRQVAFSLEGNAVVPLPAPLLPMSMGLALLGLIRRRRA